MTDDARLRRQLKARIEDRQADIDAYLQRTRPRRNVLLNISLVSSALAAVFTAGPAVAGPTFVNGTMNAFNLSSPARVWQPLCIAAFVVAIVAAVSVNLNRSYDLPARVTAAEACRAELEALLTLLQFRDLPLDEAVGLYQQYVLKVPFVGERSRIAAPAQP
jgi:hypothetical protein